MAYSELPVDAPHIHVAHVAHDVLPAGSLEVETQQRHQLEVLMALHCESALIGDKQGRQDCSQKQSFFSFGFLSDFRIALEIGIC